MRFAFLFLSLASAYAFAESVNAFGPLPPPQTLYTLGVAVLVAIIAAASRALREATGIPPWPQLLGQIGMGFVGGLVLPLFASEFKPISFGAAVVLGGLGGAFAWQVLTGIAKIVGGQYKFNIQENKPLSTTDSPKSDSSNGGLS